MFPEIKLHFPQVSVYSSHLRCDSTLTNWVAGGESAAGPNALERPTIQMTSDVILAIDAFKHVVSHFDELQTVLGQADILPQDFTVDVGFVQELGNIQGVYLYCQKLLQEKLTESLADVFNLF